MRVIVATPALAIEPPVGIVRWARGGKLVTAITKLTWSWSEDDALSLAEEQVGLVAPDDFAPGKMGVDILLRGNAYADEGSQSQGRAVVRVAAPGLERSFLVVAGAPLREIPLQAAGLYESSGEERIATVAEVQKLELPDEIRQAPNDPDLSRFNVAAPTQRSDELWGGDVVELFGLTPSGRARLVIPRECPRMIVRRPALLEEVPFVLDTLDIDTAARRVIGTYRAEIGAGTFEPFDWLFVDVTEEDVDLDWERVHQRFAKGRFFLAQERDRMDPTPEPGSGEEERIAMARMSTHATRRAPPSKLSLAEYAALSAELAEKRETPEQVLARHDLDPHLWIVEERAWLERIADSAMAGDGTLAAEYGEEFSKAQAALAAPREADFTFEDYLHVLADMEFVDNPMEYLEKRELTIPAWMRIADRWSRACQGDAALRARRDDFLSTERVKRRAEKGRA
jgi:hypothetical protein